MAIRGSVEKPLLSDCPVSQSHHVENFQNQPALEVALTIYGNINFGNIDWSSFGKRDVTALISPPSVSSSHSESQDF
jgi:hypothetical protein